MSIKEKLEKILGDFLERNKNYAVELYISNAPTNSQIGQMFITIDRTVKTDDDKFIVEWDTKHDIKVNKLSFSYSEVLSCYEEAEEYNQQIVHVLLKNSMEFKFECCGVRI